MITHTHTHTHTQGKRPLGMSFGSSQICLRNVAFRLYVCMYVYTYVLMSVCIYARMSVCVYVCHTHTDTQTHRHTDTHTRFCVHEGNTAHARTSTWMCGGQAHYDVVFTRVCARALYVCVCVCVCVHVHTSL